MLVEFRVRNFLCFRDEQSLSMVASMDSSLPSNLITPIEGAKLRLLRSVVVYGANASGKTKLLDAIMFVRSFVRNSAGRKPDDEIEIEPFKLDKAHAVVPSEFEITFIQQGVRYQYGFSADRTRVYREYLYAAPHGRTVTYFERSWNKEARQDDYHFGSSLRGENARLRAMTRANALFLSVAATFDHPMLSVPYAWFSRKLKGVQATRASDPSLRLPWSDEYHSGVQELLRLADVGISDYRLNDIPLPEQSLDPSALGQEGEKPSEIKGFWVEMLHASADQDIVALPLVSESNGTRHIFYLGPRLLDALLKGNLLVVDELDASKHPLLVRALVELFHNPTINRNNAQLIFNTHDTTLLDQTLFRRDQIYFTEKDTSGSSHLYSLLEYSPRKGESLSRGYLQGRYGAIPFLGDPSSLLPAEECQ